ETAAKTRSRFRSTGPDYAGAVAETPVGSNPALTRHARSDVVLRHRRAPPRGVAGRHRVQHLVATPVVLFRLEEDDHEGLLGLRVVEHDHLTRRHSLRRLPLAHLAVHRLHPVLVDSFESDNTCERHTSRPCGLGRLVWRSDVL